MSGFCSTKGKCVSAREAGCSALATPVTRVVCWLDGRDPCCMHRHACTGMSDGRDPCLLHAGTLGRHFRRPSFAGRGSTWPGRIVLALVACWSGPCIRLPTCGGRPQIQGLVSKAFTIANCEPPAGGSPLRDSLYHTIGIRGGGVGVGLQTPGRDPPPTPCGIPCTTRSV